MPRTVSALIPHVSLSASPDQQSYYERFGFETVREDPHAVTMVLRL